MVGLSNADPLARARQGSGSSAPSMRIDTVGRSLVVSVGRVRRSAQRMARALATESDRLAVVMPDADVALMAELAYRLRRWVPGAWDSVRLVASESAATESDGRSAGQELADMLGVEVVAPDGRLVVMPDGTLFVRDRRDGSQLRGWWRFRPGRVPESTGRRSPAPPWEMDLAAFAPPDITGVQIEQIPAGLWIHWPRTTSSKDLAYAIPVRESAVSLLVSRAGDPPLRATAVRDLIQAMPEALRERLLVIPYGDEPVADVRLGALVSQAANRTLAVRNGVPLLFSRPPAQTTAVDREGVPTWRPFARELAWRPGGASHVLDWRVPTGDLITTGPGRMLLNDRWTVEVIEAGLWIRETNRQDGASSVRQLPLDSRNCTVVVGTHRSGRMRPPWRAITRLLRCLPADARGRVRLAVPRDADDRMALAALKVCRDVLGGRPLFLLTADGRLTADPAAARDPMMPESTVGRAPRAPIARPEPVASGVSRVSRPADEPAPAPVARVVDVARPPEPAPVNVTRRPLVPSETTPARRWAVGEPIRPVNTEAAWPGRTPASAAPRPVPPTTMPLAAVPPVEPRIPAHRRPEPDEGTPGWVSPAHRADEPEPLGPAAAGDYGSEEAAGSSARLAAGPSRGFPGRSR